MSHVTRRELMAFLDGCPDSAEFVLAVGKPDGYGAVALSSPGDREQLENPILLGIWYAMHGVPDEEGEWPGKYLVEQVDGQLAAWPIWHEEGEG